MNDKMSELVKGVRLEAARIGNFCGVSPLSALRQLKSGPNIGALLKVVERIWTTVDMSTPAHAASAVRQTLPARVLCVGRRALQMEVAIWQSFWRFLT
ncbi:hypothetical protein [Cryobacterium gelidum]|uniref:Uncharacterized protein n=1 Tax=Cryobacterium gelidum TaxID=1259164 RepID=A0A4R9B065_9MICO|nr:hypothetical protein [Cryobacterium gelidum]TFD73628.1 hypothetical protein E3T50_01475 [Cryobacterium gelidum]